jgi:hypothetical protein
MSQANKIIARIKGGLGNQLFCYAAARRLALATGSELVLDDVTGFARDALYRRQYVLDRFEIPCRRATPWERMEPFERLRRGFAKAASRRLPFERRPYLEQEGEGFDPRLLALKPKGTLYLDGLWQSEHYFEDVKDRLRADLRIVPPSDAANRDMAARIAAKAAVSLHVRWFAPAGSDVRENAMPQYYRRAVALMRERRPDAHFFLFSDDPAAARDVLDLPAEHVTVVDHNRSDDMAYADLWLMSQCRDLVLSNSTFSWWAAWLAEGAGPVGVVAPGPDSVDAGAWNFSPLVPERWRLL